MCPEDCGVRERKNEAWARIQLVVVVSTLIVQDIAAPEGPSLSLYISSLFTRMKSGVTDLPAQSAGRSVTCGQVRWMTIWSNLHFIRLTTTLRDL